MSGKKKVIESKKISYLFLILPTFMLIFGYFVNPYPELKLATSIISISMFLAPILLGIGYIIKEEGEKNTLKIFGWMVFAFYWSTQPTKLYFSE